MLRLGSVLENGGRYEESIMRMVEGVQLKNAVELEQIGRGFRRIPRPPGKVNDTLIVKYSTLDPPL